MAVNQNDITRLNYASSLWTDASEEGVSSRARGIAQSAYESQALRIAREITPHKAFEESAYNEISSYEGEEFTTSTAEDLQKYYANEYAAGLGNGRNFSESVDPDFERWSDQVLYNAPTDAELALAESDTYGSGSSPGEDLMDSRDSNANPGSSTAYAG